jgi:hypothetical protein
MHRSLASPARSRSQRPAGLLCRIATSPPSDTGSELGEWVPGSRAGRAWTRRLQPNFDEDVVGEHAESATPARATTTGRRQRMPLECAARQRGATMRGLPRTTGLQPQADIAGCHHLIVALDDVLLRGPRCGSAHTGYQDFGRERRDPTAPSRLSATGRPAHRSTPQRSTNHRCREHRVSTVRARTPHSASAERR